LALADVLDHAKEKAAIRVKGRCPFIECIQWRGFPLYDGFNRPKKLDFYLNIEC
jgi:hypothetical protein